MKPHLVHVGWAKAGSTILRDWFTHHPQIAFKKGGLLGVRSAFDIVKGQVSDPSTIRLRVTSEESFTSPHRTAGEDTIGHIGPNAAGRDMTPEQVCEQLQDLFPEAHVLIVTRGFRDVIFSSYSQAVKRGGMHFFLPWMVDFGVPGHHAFGKWDYDAAIEAYEAAFPGRVTVLPYELLRENPDEFIRQLEGMFGLDHMPLPARTMNKSLSAVELAWYPFFTIFVRYAPLFGALKRRLLLSYFARMSDGRLVGAARLFQRLFPRKLPHAGMIGDEVVQRFAPNARSLRSRPVYQKYLKDYFPEG